MRSLSLGLASGPRAILLAAFLPAMLASPAYATTRMLKAVPDRELRVAVDVDGTVLTIEARSEDAYARRTVTVREETEPLLEGFVEPGRRIMGLTVGPDATVLGRADDVTVERLVAKGLVGALRQAAIDLPSTAPDPALRELRLQVVELYAAAAALDEPATGKKPQEALPPEGVTCAVETIDALFDCVDASGHREAVVPLLDGPRPAASSGKIFEVAATAPGFECYGACGSGCGGLCMEVLVGCRPGESSGAACVKLAATAARPFETGGELAIDTTACGRVPEGARPLKVCSAAPCCFLHDECNRNDGLGSWVACQVWGLQRCGFPAVYGRPPGGWDLRWFDADGRAVDLHDVPGAAGTCTAESPPQWTPPSPVDHATTQQFACPMHDVKH